MQHARADSEMTLWSYTHDEYVPYEFAERRRRVGTGKKDPVGISEKKGEKKKENADSRI